jgi:hypothetical protein
MRRLGLAVSGILLLALVLPWLGNAAEERLKEPASPPQGLENPEPPSVQNPAMPLYRAPKGSVPGGRLKGGIRAGKDVPVLQVLAPNHVGLTRQRQPVLYWYISKVSKYPIEFTLVDSRAMEPLIETRLRQPTVPGVQYIRLKDYDVSLEPGVPYRWFVTLVVDDLNPSKDIVAGAIIERVDFVESLLIFEEDPARLAGAGLWYDAIRRLSELMEAHPNDPFIAMQRAALLSQVGLPEIAEADMRRNGRH